MPTPTTTTISLPTGAIGLNLDAVSSSSGDCISSEIFSTTGGFTDIRLKDNGPQAPVSVDSDGWATTDFCVYLFNNTNLPFWGKLLIEFTGKADVSAFFGLVTDYAYDPATNRSRAVLGPKPGYYGVCYLICQNTQRNSLAPVKSGITNITIHRSKSLTPTTTTKADFYDSTKLSEIFPQQDIDYLADFDFLRYMDYLNVNNEVLLTREWSQRIRPTTMFRRALGTERAVATVLDYLLQPNPGYVLTCTHQTLNVAIKQLASTAQLGKALLLLDESHHSGAKVLSRTLSTWSGQGGRVVFTTATPYRSDARAATLPGMLNFRRSIAEHMDGGRYAPSRIEQHFVPIGRKGDKVSFSEITGTTVSRYKHVLDEIISKMVADWIKLGYPKLILRVPIVPGGSSDFVERIIAAFRAVRVGNGKHAATARVLDATGTRDLDSQRTRVALLSERDRSSLDSEYEVMVGIQRVKEGFDWPHCSTVFSVGIPGSLQEIIQLLGRALRWKELGYAPPEHRDRATIRFYVPCAGGSLVNLDREHTIQAFAGAVYIADWRTGESFNLTRIVRESIRKMATPRPGRAPAAADSPDAEAPLHIDHNLPPDQLLRVKAVIAAVQEEHPTTTTPGRLLAALREQVPEVDQAGLNVVVEQIVAHDQRLKAEVEADLSSRIARIGKSRRFPIGWFDEVFAASLERFRDESLCPIESVGELGVQVHKMTGQNMREWAKRLRVPVALSDEQIIDLIRRYHEQTGKWPSTDSDRLVGQVAWVTLDNQLRSRHGDKHGLAWFRLLHFPESRSNMQRDQSTDAQIIDLIRRYHEQTGKWPNTTSDRFVGQAAWVTLDNQLRSRHGDKHGLAWFRLLYFPESRSHKQRDQSTDAQIIDLIRRYHEQTGKWPNRTSDRLVGQVAWVTLDNQLRSRHGDKHGLAWFRLLHFPESRSNMQRDQSTDAQIIDLIRRYHEQTGKWPNTTSDRFVGQAAWVTLDNQLRSRHGDKHGLAWFRLLYFPESRSHKQRDQSTDAQIIDLIRRYHEQTGKWPNRTSDRLVGQAAWVTLNGQLRSRHGDKHGLAWFRNLHFPESLAELKKHSHLNSFQPKP